jgi:hypothetical protein
VAYYLSKERDADVGAYRRYQEYLQAHRHAFPPSAFALATAEWYQNANDHRCPHDGWLDTITISEPATGERSENRLTSIRVRLSGAYHDGIIELFYERVFSYSLLSPSAIRGLGDWRYDEFRLRSSGGVIHEIEWAGFGDSEGSRWVIEASDVEYQWIPKQGYSSPPARRARFKTTEATLRARSAPSRKTDCT